MSSPVDTGQNPVGGRSGKAPRNFLTRFELLKLVFRLTFFNVLYSVYR